MKPALTPLVVLLGLLTCACLPGSRTDGAGLTPGDTTALTELRTALVEAIEAGDAIRYASLCTDDVQLLHPNAPLVTGKAELQAHNAEIFKVARVTSLVLTPVQVYGEGDIAYEVGTQTLIVEPAIPGFSSNRKYVHVLRRGMDGVWRFAALMSNDSE